MRRTLAVAFLGLVLASCGGGSLSLAEYNEQGMALGAVMEERIDALDAAWDSQTATLEEVQTYWDRRTEAYEKALEGFRALKPTRDVADLHRAGMEMFTKLVAAEKALAVRVASFETATGPEQWWNTPEGAAVAEVGEEIYSFCLEFQAMYDATLERMIVSDVPWIPSEMKEVVQVDIGCETVLSDR